MTEQNKDIINDEPLTETDEHNEESDQYEYEKNDDYDYTEQDEFDWYSNNITDNINCDLQ